MVSKKLVLAQFCALVAPKAVSWPRLATFAVWRTVFGSCGRHFEITAVVSSLWPCFCFGGHLDFGDGFLAAEWAFGGRQSTKFVCRIGFGGRRMGIRRPPVNKFVCRIWDSADLSEIREHCGVHQSTKFVCLNWHSVSAGLNYLFSNIFAISCTSSSSSIAI